MPELGSRCHHKHFGIVDSKVAVDLFCGGPVGGVAQAAIRNIRLQLHCLPLIVLPQGQQRFIFPFTIVVSAVNKASGGNAAFVVAADTAIQPVAQVVTDNGRNQVALLGDRDIAQPKCQGKVRRAGVRDQRDLQEELTTECASGRDRFLGITGCVQCQRPGIHRYGVVLAIDIPGHGAPGRGERERRFIQHRKMRAKALPAVQLHAPALSVQRQEPVDPGDRRRPPMGARRHIVQVGGYGDLAVQTRQTHILQVAGGFKRLQPFIGLGRNQIQHLQHPVPGLQLNLVHRQLQIALLVTAGLDVHCRHFQLLPVKPQVLQYQLPIISRAPVAGDIAGGGFQVIQGTHRCWRFSIAGIFHWLLRQAQVTAQGVPGLRIGTQPQAPTRQFASRPVKFFRQRRQLVKQPHQIGVDQQLVQLHIAEQGKLFAAARVAAPFQNQAQAFLTGVQAFHGAGNKGTGHKAVKTAAVFQQDFFQVYIGGLAVGESEPDTGIAHQHLGPQLENARGVAETHARRAAIRGRPARQREALHLPAPFRALLQLRRKPVGFQVFPDQLAVPDTRQQVQVKQAPFQFYLSLGTDLQAIHLKCDFQRLPL